MKEPYSNRTDVQLKPEVSGAEDQISLTPSRNPQSQSPAKAIPQPTLNPYQQRLSQELKSRPKTMDLLGVIFSQYPAIIVREFRQTNPNATARQRREGRRTSIIRMQMEVFIEEEIAKLSGIDIDKLQELAKEDQDKASKKKEKVDSSSPIQPASPEVEDESPQEENE